MGLSLAVWRVVLHKKLNIFPSPFRKRTFKENIDKVYAVVLHNVIVYFPKVTPFHGSIMCNIHAPFCFSLSLVVYEGQKLRSMAAAAPGATNYHVPISSVKAEAKFYDDAEATRDHLAEARRKLSAQNAEFEALLEYYVRNRAHLDVKHRSTFHPGGELPNLGTPDPSWYYLDERGNKIWVRNLTLEGGIAISSNGTWKLPHTGAFCDAKNNDGKVVTVTVPKAKRHHGLPSDYKRRLVEVDAQIATIKEGRRPTSRGGQYSGDDIETYIEAQRRLAASLRTGALASEDVVFRPPATISEAELRLAELQREERELVNQLKTL